MLGFVFAIIGTAILWILVSMFPAPFTYVTNNFYLMCLVVLFIIFCFAVLTNVITKPLSRFGPILSGKYHVAFTTMSP